MLQALGMGRGSLSSQRVFAMEGGPLYAPLQAREPRDLEAHSALG